MSQSPQPPESMTAEPARPLHDRSGRFARVALAIYWPVLALGTHWPNARLPQPPAHPLLAVLQLDKVIHTIAFGGLMLLVLLSGLGGRRLTWPARCTVALVITMTYAIADELTQGLMPGRTVSAADLITNITAVLGIYLIARQPRRRQAKRIAWWVVLPMVVLAIAAIGALLSPWAMDRAVELKRSLIPPGTFRHQRLDYWVHTALGFFTSVLVFTLWLARSGRPRLATIAALLMLLLSGPAVEVMQHFTGRVVQAMDVLHHTVGVLLAMIAWALWPGSTAPATLDDNAPPPDESTSFVGHAVLVSALTLLSRFAGLARDAVLAAVLGLSVAADAFFIGFLVPNLFRRLFGEGALTAAFIPSYTDLLERDPTLAKRFATLTLTLLSVLLISITLIAELALWRIATTIDETHKASLAIYYTRLMLPYMPLICAVAFVGGVLQVHKRFGPPAAAPLILNGVIVMAVLLATTLFAGETDPKRIATWVAFGVVCAGVLQLIWQVAALLTVTELTRSFRGCWPAMRSMLIMMGPMVIGLAVFQINALLDALIAFFFAPASGAAATDPLTMFGQTFDAPLRNGDVAALSWSQRLYQFPLGVFGIAIATAIFPALSAAAAKFATNDNDKAQPNKPQPAPDAFAKIVRHGLRLTIFIALPASVGLILVRVPLARTIFEHGDFTTDDALRVSAILAGYASSIWAYSMTHTVTRAFYALKDATTPLKVGAAMVLLNLTLNLTLIWPLGAAGLAWSTAISAACQAALLIFLLRRRVTQPIDRSVLTSWARALFATAIMAAALLPIAIYFDPAALNWNQSAGLLAGMVALGIAIVFVIAKLCKCEELQWLKRSKR